MIITEKLSASSVAALHFISNKNSTIFCAKRPDQLHKAFSSKINSSNTLNTFYYNSSSFISGSFKIIFQSFFIIERKKNNIISFVYRSNYFRIVGSCNGKRCSSMERFAERYDLFSTGVKRGQL